MLKNQEYYDVVIVGAGVAGLYLSNLLEKNGVDYVTFEKNKKIGKYGNRIISIEAFKKLNVEKSVIRKNIKEMDFLSPSGIKISKKDKKTRGYVVNLSSLEKGLFSNLKNKNKIFLNHPVKNADLNRGLLVVKNNKIRAKIIVFACGVSSNFLNKKFIKNSPRTIFCYTNEIRGKDKITTIIDNKKAHGFYAWIMPLSESIIEVGFGTDKFKKLSEKGFDETLFSFPRINQYKNSKKIKKIGGFIPTSIIKKRCGKNWILIGDASGGEALMGGSIHKSADEALLAFNVIKRFIGKKISSLKEYDKTWEKTLGKDFYKQQSIRNILDQASNKELDEVFKTVQKNIPDGKGLINELFKNIIINLVKLKRRK